MNIHKPGALDIRVHRDLVGRTVFIPCTCGTRVKSKGGETGAWSAFDKHVKRAASKAVSA